MSKSKTGSIDTNVLLRFVVDDIPAQTKLVETLFQQAQCLHVSDLALAESIFVLARYYQMKRADVAVAIRAVIGLKVINCNRSAIDQALDLYVKRPSLSFEDCLLVTYARLNQVTPLYTFDEKLAKFSPDAKLVA